MKIGRVILNGKSAGNAEVRSAIYKLRDEGHSLEVRTTWEGGDAARLAKEAAGDGVDVLVAGGGDGTIHEVVNGLMSAEVSKLPALAVLPLGTANDFANGNGIPLEPYDALKLACEGKSFPIDVLSANGIHFVNMATGGFGAEVTVGTPKEMKDALGGAAYALTGVVTAAKLQPYQGRATSMGEQKEGKFIVLGVGNARQAGGGVPMCPHAYIDDGMMDVMVIEDFDMIDLGKVGIELGDVRGKDNQYVHYRKRQVLDIELTTKLPINLDGEPYRWDKIQFKVHPKALNLVAPDDDHLLRANNL